MSASSWLVSESMSWVLWCSGVYEEACLSGTHTDPRLRGAIRGSREGEPITARMGFLGLLCFFCTMALPILWLCLPWSRCIMG